MGLLLDDDHRDKEDSPGIIVYPNLSKRWLAQHQNGFKFEPLVQLQKDDS